MSLPHSRRWWLLALNVLAAACAGFGALALARSMDDPIGTYDEGILLTHSHLLLRGLRPHLDFYVNYPVGMLWAIAGMWKLTGVSVAVVRVLGVLIHVGIALLAGRLVGRALGGSFSFWTAGLALGWGALLGSLPFAYFAALFAAFLFAELAAWASERGGEARWLVPGLGLGAVSWFRHDLFGYCVAGVAVSGAVHSVFLRRPPSAVEARRAGWFVGGIGLAMAPLWLPLLASAGPSLVLKDLVFDQVRYVQPARVLPLPDLLAGAPTSLGFSLPVVLCRPFEASVALSLAAPALAALAVALTPATPSSRRAAVGLLSLLAIATVPQALVRTDLPHGLQVVAAPLTLACVLVVVLADGCERPRLSWPVQATLSVALVAILVGPLGWALPQVSRAARFEHRVAGVARYEGLPETDPATARARQDVLSFIARNSREDEPIYVGLVDHSRVFVSEIDLYFLANRIGATRYLQFDPNVINRLDVQQQMAREIEAAGVRIAVLSERFQPFEPNESQRVGATFLDEYFRAHFSLAGRSGPYLLLVRSAPTGAGPHRPGPSE